MSPPAPIGTMGRHRSRADRRRGGPVAELRIEGDELVLHLDGFERVAGLHRSIRVPASSVTAVDVVDDPVRSVAGVRAPGLAVPWHTKIGTWRARGERRFVVARRGRPAVRVRLAGQTHSELLVSVADAPGVASALRAATGPGASTVGA
jgi:hypothetical protein